ncbi:MULTISPECIES: hypothetical protein [Mycobacteriaceae]|jgi:hypothetical protein|uniref:Uncharacterized protein n=2 Tax=Mycobacteriaceae TaxID=1762 RepID=A0A1Q9WG55_9MYCO|nr:MULTISPECIES: hypothetical protein [Mycobacteriaceae]MBP2451858.1 hypothetical protein [Mycolicibacterium lutetiense]OHT92479.1 hypothetical protein BKG61_24330 [Mycobacterium syngnathidarum]OLT97750.1 hypothetical protein BKG60_05140 [Mycobacterium syngnathidarum]
MRVFGRDLKEGDVVVLSGVNCHIRSILGGDSYRDLFTDKGYHLVKPGFTYTVLKRGGVAATDAESKT